MNLEIVIKEAKELAETMYKKEPVRKGELGLFVPNVGKDVAEQATVSVCMSHEVEEDHEVFIIESAVQKHIERNEEAWDAEMIEGYIHMNDVRETDRLERLRSIGV